MSEQTATLQKLIIHYVGSKNHLDPLILSHSSPEPDDETTRLLRDSFLNRFKDNKEYHSFTHPTSLQYNEVYQYCKQLFDGTNDFETLSASIARHLYEQSTHPKVRGGELFVVLFEGLPVQGRTYRALGLFKSEHKSTFMQLLQKKSQVDIRMHEGVELHKTDKGCLVINRHAEEGFDVLIFDNQNRGEEAQYWKEKFLGLTPQQNEFHHTAHLMSLTKQFITGPLEAEAQITRTEQVELLHRSLDYFRENDSFDIEQYQSQVFESEDRIHAFRQFGSQYVQNHAYDIASSFDISPDAVRKQTRIFKSVLKLDKNFHIYIHGRTDLIERGTDAQGKYYKIYFEEER